MLSVTIDRSGLSLADLVITDTAPTTGFFLPDTGVGRPEKTKRRQYADPSPFYAGQLLVASVPDQGNQSLAVYAVHTATTGLYALMDELEAAVDQFGYTITVTEDGATRVWTCDTADVTWGDITYGLTSNHIARASMSIPVYPVSA